MMNGSPAPTVLAVSDGISYNLGGLQAELKGSLGGGAPQKDVCPFLGHGPVLDPGPIFFIEALWPFCPRPWN